MFSLASGHMYERLIKIMMLSVLKRSSWPVKFWYLEQYLSPGFKVGASAAWHCGILGWADINSSAERAPSFGSEVQLHLPVHVIQVARVAESADRKAPSDVGVSRDLHFVTDKWPMR